MVILSGTEMGWLGAVLLLGMPVVFLMVVATLLFWIGGGDRHEGS